MRARRRAAAEVGLLPLPKPLTEDSAREWAASHADDELRRSAGTWLRLATCTGALRPASLKNGVEVDRLGREEGWW